MAAVTHCHAQLPRQSSPRKLGTGGVVAPSPQHRNFTQRVGRLDISFEISRSPCQQSSDLASFWCSVPFFCCHYPDTIAPFLLLFFFRPKDTSIGLSPSSPPFSDHLVPSCAFCARGCLCLWLLFPFYLLPKSPLLAIRHCT